MMLDETAEMMLAEGDRLQPEAGLAKAHLPDGWERACGTRECMKFTDLLVIFGKLVLETQGNEATLMVIGVGVAAMLGLQATLG